MPPVTAPRPVMDIQPQRPVARPLPRTDYATATVPIGNQPQAALSADMPHEVQPIPEHFPAKLPKAKAPVGAIMAAILVGGCLMAVAVFAYLKSQDKPAVATTDQAATTAVTAEEVGESLTAADEALTGMDDATDFNEADLSDTSLGL